MPDVSVICTIGGTDVSKAIVSWQVTDAEEGASEIMVKIKSHNLEYADSFDYLQDMEIRFGTGQDMSDMATLPVDSIEPEFGTKEYDTVTIVARDPSRHLAGGKHRGKCEKDDVEDILKDELQASGLNGDLKLSGTAKLKSPAIMNENSRQFLWRMMRYGKDKSGKGGPSNPMSNEKGGGGGGSIERNQGNSWSSAAGMHEEGHDYDDYRGKDDNHRHGSEPLTATLSLKGYPKLKAKTCVAMQGYGSMWSGTWYVKQVVHKGGATEAYTTQASLIRGGTGSGGVGGDPPIVMYGELYSKGKVFLGHRKTDQSPSHTFTRGDKVIVKFKPKLNPQPQRGAGEPKKGKGRGLDLRDELKDFDDGPAGGGE